MNAFTYTANAARIVFGAGVLARLPEEVERLGAKRALVLSTPEQAEAAQRVAALLGERSAGVFPRAVMHVPLETARAALLSRIELRGEKAEVLLDAHRRRKRERALARRFSRGLDVTPTKRHRALAWVLVARALVARVFHGRETASELSHWAHQADPGWYFPPLLQGRIWHAAGISRAAKR